jgi:2-polyprenyl-6-hydroxyphenyl methylase/3-demethylubiquinone-9 3-methyltransferase
MPARVDPIETQAHWEALASGYDVAKARNDAYYRTLKALIERWVTGAAPARDDGASSRGQRRILDVGCGTGQILAHLDDAGVLGEGLGIDASPRMIEAAKRRGAGSPRVSFRVMDAAGAGALGPFDAVVCADLLEHVPDWRAVAAALVGACAPGGTIVVTTPNPRWAVPLWVLEKLRLKMPEGPHAFVPRRAIAAHLEASGAEVIHASTALLVPARLLGLGPLVSRLAARAPVLRGLGVIQLVVARRRERA